MGLRNFVASATIALTATTTSWADPCGMVPPVWEGQGPAITRIGLQKTYVFHKNGVETFVIRPGFQGKVDNFGMLIPFPSVPSIRKVPDEVFAHLDAAIDPPTVTIDLRPRRKYSRRSKSAPSKSKKMDVSDKDLEVDEVRVLKQEAVGMYEIAVLEAGSPKALSRWMEDHGFQYPEGMDGPVLDYVKEKWCFVAVKTRVGAKAQADPRPGMRSANPQLPSGAGFDGHVQAMGFRFAVKQPVVPMRLSSFNAGELRNLVYYVGTGPVKVQHLPSELVQRQVSGQKLYRHVTDLLPVRILGGGMRQVPKERFDWMKAQRSPVPHNGIARDLFASDLLAAKTKQLAHDFEEREKQLLNVSERLNLRGPQIDAQHQDEIAKERKKTLDGMTRSIRGITLTLVDGDLPREFIAKNNLSFARYRMPQSKNDPHRYHARHHDEQPEWEREGVYVDRAIADWATREKPELAYWNSIWEE